MPLTLSLISLSQIKYSSSGGNRTVDRSPSLSPIGDVVVICCKAGSQTYLPEESLGDDDGNGEALQQNKYLNELT
ncbi:hypothetical protein TIFTF001_007331 [Ficus carica]|uniref:Uncharacterized protein n=1 Tax=Ficus carica TaxID=3494 RepID=A0AA87ZT81_FICCA|nr:hypothetical protein TIFTF001_007331 [Ficus carica]